MVVFHHIIAGKKERYDWVTQDMFNEVLETIMMENTETLLHVPGVFEALSEHFNNEVLQRCEEQRLEEARDAE